MKSIFTASLQLLPSRRAMTVYWLISLAWIIAVSFGLKISKAGPGELWSLPISSGFGSSPQSALRAAYVELIQHLWTLLFLPAFCFGGLKPLVDSYAGDFEQFLRFGRRNKFFIELSRVFALGISLTGYLLPFVVAGFWGLYRPGLPMTDVATIVSSCFGCAILVSSLVVALASTGVLSEVPRALGIVAPFFLAGVFAFENNGGFAIAKRLPPGLPYAWEGHRALFNCLLPALILVAVRLAITARTRWLTANARGIAKAAMTGRHSSRGSVD